MMVLVWDAKHPHVKLNCHPPRLAPLSLFKCVKQASVQESFRLWIVVGVAKTQYTF